MFRTKMKLLIRNSAVEMFVSSTTMTYWLIIVCLLLQHSPSQAFMESPKFSQLRLLFPGYRHHGGEFTTDDVIKMVLGDTPTDESLHGGSAAMRLSWTLNRYGGRHSVGRAPVNVSGLSDGDSLTGRNGLQYIFRSEAFGPFLALRYGDPIVSWATTTGHDVDGGHSTRRRRPRPPLWTTSQSSAILAGRQGIVRIVRDKGSHVGLWDCSRFYQSRDWLLDSRIIAVEFWESPDSYCHSAVKHSTSNQKVLSTDTPLQLVPRHNFASPPYLNDESHRKLTEKRQNTVWLQ